MVNSRIKGEREECNPGMFYGARNIEIEEEKECWGFTEEQMEET